MFRRMPLGGGPGKLMMTTKKEWRPTKYCEVLIQNRTEDRIFVIAYTCTTPASAQGWTDPRMSDKVIAESKIVSHLGNFGADTKVIRFTGRRPD